MEKKGKKRIKAKKEKKERIRHCAEVHGEEQESWESPSLGFGSGAVPER